MQLSMGLKNWALSRPWSIFQRTRRKTLPKLMDWADKFASGQYGPQRDAIRDCRTGKPIFAMDFQNVAEYVGGCIAGGRRYLHINADVNVDSCVFIHYSDSSIRQKTLLEALRSPCSWPTTTASPMLRPCPMPENPEKLRKMVADTGAHSTAPSLRKSWAPQRRPAFCGFALFRSFPSPS